jgi:hypothetical protein
MYPTHNHGTTFCYTDLTPILRLLYENPTHMRVRSGDFSR